MTRLATVIDPGAESLSRMRRPDRLALLLGSETKGLSPEREALCDRSMTISMHRGADSLSVAVSAGIILPYVEYLAEGET